MVGPSNENVQVPLATGLTAPPEFIVAPEKPKEMIGLRNFIRLSGLGSPEEISGFDAAGLPFQDILRGIIGPNGKKKFHQFIQLLKGKPGDDILSQIKIEEIDGNYKGTDLSLLDAINIYEKSDETIPAADLIRILVEEAQERTQEDSTIEINLEPASNPQRVQRLAEALGIKPEDIEARNLDQMLEYLAALSKRVDELRDFSTAEASYAVTRKRIPETIMLDKVALQGPSECVLFSTYNLAQAALNQNADIRPVDVDQMRGIIPEGGVGRVMGNEWVNYVQSQGFNISSDFNWGEALKTIQEKRGGLVVRLSEAHAVAVVGIRHNSSQPPAIEFLVANSLPAYPPISEPGKPVWVNAKELITQTVMLQPDNESRIDNYLLTWQSKTKS